MYEIGVSAHFTASHRLRGPFGLATERHSHRYRVDVWARGPALDENGTLCDLAALQHVVDGCALALHHRDLDDLPPFHERNSTAEHLARYLFDVVTRELRAP